MMNECNSEWTEESAKKFHSHYFPRPVAKAIVESDAFIFPNLLPLHYNQKVGTRLLFAPSEDNLLIYGIDQLRHTKLSWKEKAQSISGIMMPCRPTDAIYHRIRNLRKKDYGQRSQNVLVSRNLNFLPGGFLTVQSLNFVCDKRLYNPTKIDELVHNFID